MTVHEWHASPALLARFTHDPAGVDDMTASSVEAHLVACGACRHELRLVADPAAARASWDAVADVIDRPRPSFFERLLLRLGIDGGLATLIAATPALRAAGIGAIALLALGAALLSRGADAQGPFLILAPLAPLVAVAAAFAPAGDPAGEAGVGTPLHGAALVVRRSLAVLALTFLLLATATLALPDLDTTAAAWALPALALALGALALGTWMRVEAAVAALCGGWLLAVWSLWWAAGHDGPVADTAAFAATGQSAALALAATSAVIAVARRHHFATLEAFR